MTTKTKAMPTLKLPLKLWDVDHHVILDAVMSRVATVGGGHSAHANAAHIVRCVNSHAALLDACRAAWEIFAVPGGVGKVIVEDSLRRMLSMKLEAAIAAAERGDA